MSRRIPPHGCILFSSWSWVRPGPCSIPRLWTGLTHHICKRQAHRVLSSEESWEISPRGWRFEGCSFLRPGAVLLLAFPAQSSQKLRVNTDVAGSTSINHQWCPQRESRTVPGSEEETIWLSPAEGEERSFTNARQRALCLQGQACASANLQCPDIQVMSQA